MDTAIPTLKTLDDCVRYAQTINPKKAPLTQERLRQFSGCRHYDEEQALQLVQLIEQLATALFETVVARQAQASQPETVSIMNFSQPYLCTHKQNAA